MKIYKSEKSTEKYTVKELSPTIAQKGVLKKISTKKYNNVEWKNFKSRKVQKKISRSTDLFDKVPKKVYFFSMWSYCFSNTSQSFLFQFFFGRTSEQTTRSVHFQHNWSRRYGCACVPGFAKCGYEL